MGVGEVTFIGIIWLLAMISEEMGGSQLEDSLNIELQEYRKKNQQLRRRLREKDTKIQ